MNDPKVWAVLGAKDGLGSAAIKYLVANKQVVIAFPVEPFSKKDLKDIIATYGAIDFIINNSNYKLFHGAVKKTSVELQNDISKDISATIKLIKTIIPYLRKAPKGKLINIPPQLCLTGLTDKTDAEKLAFAMGSFLKTLQAELQVLDCRLSFLEPGERVANFSI